MKITVQSNELKKGLAIVNRGIGSRPQLPILSGILMKVDENTVNLVSTDLEVSFWVKVQAQIEEPGEIVVPSKLFSELVTSLPAGNLEIETDNNTIKVHSKGIKSEIIGQPADDFPSIPRAKEPQLFLNGGDFRMKIDRVCVSSAKDDTRPILTGVLWELSEKQITLAATDGYRLSVDKIKIEKTLLLNETKFILPARSLQEISKVLLETGDDEFGVEFDKENQQVMFLVGGIEITSRLIAGEFPPYQQIMPNTYSTKMTFGKNELLEAVKRANLFARDNANIIKIKANNEIIEISAESSQVGNNITEIKNEDGEGEEINVAFNARYLLDYLSVSATNNIVWETEGDLKPSVFKSEENDSWVQIIMPVRVQ